ncbi:unnamed protein product [Chrysodeixis includens]|uniref:F-box domain-containing protein n=1 Tax=Chrysodeixis includens TaxID=689277 RepID=A0A9N8L7L8_CHRIL|nr:unnamed protein product [Chrysodeixis includens]
MALDWETLPLLPLTCIMDHLSTEDALAAMSTCRHWRNAMLLYEGRRHPFKIRAKHNLEKNLFIARIFKKHTRSLHVFVDCSDTELEKFMNLILPQVITESLVFKHLRNLQRLQFLGCRLNTLHNENEVYAHKQIEYYSRPLNISSVQTPADAILSSGNQHLMQYATLKPATWDRESWRAHRCILITRLEENLPQRQLNRATFLHAFRTTEHIVLDYEHLSTTALMTLAHLPNFEYLSLNITNKRLNFLPIDWTELQLLYKKPLLVTVNIIAVPIRRFNDIMLKVLVSNITLISLKVMFCKSLFTPLLSHVSRLYEASLREVVWADSPHDSLDPYQRIVRPLRMPHASLREVVWADSPHDSLDPYQRIVRPLRMPHASLREVVWADSPHDSLDPYQRIVRPLRMPHASLREVVWADSPHDSLDPYQRIVRPLRMPHASLREVVWADSPHDSLDPYQRIVRPLRMPHASLREVVWADSPHDSLDPYQRIVRPLRMPHASLREVVWADSPHDSLDPYQRIVRPLRMPHASLREVVWADSPHDSLDPYQRIVRPLRMPHASLREVVWADSPHDSLDPYQRIVRPLRMPHASLREVVWADSPHDSLDPYQRIVRPLRMPHPDTYAHVNPFVLLCWQCVHLQRLVIHGYWVWQYDLLGFVRLRKTLSHLDISAIYSKQDRYSHAIQMSEEGCVRVMCGDPPSDIDADFVQEVNEYIDFKWTPQPISALHPAIRGPCSAATRSSFVLREASRPDWARINEFDHSIERRSHTKDSSRPTHRTNIHLSDIYEPISRVNVPIVDSISGNNLTDSSIDSASIPRQLGRF